MHLVSNSIRGLIFSSKWTAMIQWDLPRVGCYTLPFHNVIIDLHRKYILLLLIHVILKVKRLLLNIFDLRELIFYQFLNATENRLVSFNIQQCL